MTGHRPEDARSGPGTEGSRLATTVHVLMRTARFAHPRRGDNAGVFVPGLSPAAEAVYRIALAESSWATDDLVAACTSRTALTALEVRTAVDELLTDEFLRPASERSRHDLRVAAPAVVLEAPLARSRDALVEQQRQLDEAVQLMRDLEELHEGAQALRVEHTVERMTGLDAVRGRLEQLAKDTEHEALAFMRSPQTAESVAASWPLDRDALARGVNLRSIYLHSALNDPATIAYVRRLGEVGAESRTVATLPLQMLIVDRSTAVIPIDAEDAAAGALVIRSSGAVVALLALFESVWSGARVVGQPRRSDALELSDTDREILRILSSGATDEVVARQLGVSVRTVRRQVSLLMERHQARSRFELGRKIGQQEQL